MATETEIREGMLASGRAVIDHLYNAIEPNTPTEYRSANIADALGMSLNKTDDRCVELVALGVLSREIAGYNKPQPDGTVKIGRYFHWTLLVTKEEALRRHAEWGQKLLAGETSSQAMALSTGRVKYDKGKTKPKDPTNYKNQPHVAPGGPIERVTIAKDKAEDTRAVAGPEAPKPLAALAPLRKADDATALVEAARQYANRTDNIDDSVTKLMTAAKSLGVEIDEAALRLSIHILPDERLETISLVLPVIDRLERTVERLTATVEQMREKAKETERLTIENRRLRARVEGLVSDRVVSQQRAQA